MKEVFILLTETRSKLVMIGDLITGCERAPPVREGLFDAIPEHRHPPVEGENGKEETFRVI